MLFAIITQKEIPSVLMLEEPETGIHPRRIGEIMEYIFEQITILARKKFFLHRAHRTEGSREAQHLFAKFSVRKRSE